jgi:hypothetical protein
MQNQIPLLLLASSIIGILFLFVISQNLEIKEIPLNKLSNQNLGEKILVKGKIQEISYQKSSIEIVLENQNKSNLEIIMFTDKILNLKQNQTVQIYGKLDSYRNKLQLIVDKIAG